MLTRIVQHSPALESFLDSLHLPLSQPQRDHLLHLVDGSLVCEERKTLAALQRQFLDSTDPSNWADFLRISPWFAEDVRCAIRRHQVAWLVAEAQRRSLPKVLYVNLDDSLGKKDKRTSRLEPVDWFHDHNESTPRHPRYYKAFCYLECTLHAEDLTATADLAFISATRPCGDSTAIVPPSSGCTFAASSAKPLLPEGWVIYVQFDSWYASERLLKYIHRQGWHAVCGLKSNRKFSGQRLDQFGTTLQHKRYTRVRVTAADGNTTTYHVRDAVGRLSKVPFDVRVMFSKRHPRAQSWAYFASTDLARSVVETLRGYGGRWSCEVVNFYTKTQLGLADFRVWSYEAVERYVIAVHLAWAYVEEQLVRTRSAQVRCYGDVIRRHRDDHAAAWLRAAVEQGIRTGDVEAVLKLFLRQAS